MCERGPSDKKRGSDLLRSKAQGEEVKGGALFRRRKLLEPREQGRGGWRCG
jgi:hypothetical protein